MKIRNFIIVNILVLISPMVFLASCGEPHKKEQATTQKKEKYTCPMHPQIIKDSPGTCPICFMDLVPVGQASGTGLILSERQQALANISTMVIGNDNVSGFRQLNAVLAVNPEKTETVSSRTAGRIEQLYVRETGVTVNAGQPLYKIYSEELATLEQEYLLALAQVREFPTDATFKKILTGARQKLDLYQLSPAEIQKLAQSKKADPYITYHARQSGTVVELSVTQGQYVSEGSPIMQLEAYNNLWVEADVYAAEAPLVKVGKSVKVVVSGWENSPQTVKISFLAPSLASGKQILRIRAEIPNPNKQWQPGLQANVFLPTTDAKAQSGISLPVNAVLRTGEGMAHVWVKKGKETFEPKMVSVGAENPDKIEITQGLSQGDTVVVTGAYLLYSESILKKGKDPAAEMHM